MSATESIEPSRLVERWQRPIYNLAYRLLGNAADAADATQEIFAIVLRKIDRYDPSRELQPWIYRVATRQIREYARKQRVRADREQRAAREESRVMAGSDVAEKRELEQVVQNAVGRLPEASRALVVLHYFNGLSQSEVAEVLALPRTTVRSRLEKCLETLRSRLRDSGYPAVCVGLEPLLRETTQLVVPAALEGALFKLAAGSASAATSASTGIALGGIAVNKSLAFVVGLVVVTLAVGVGIGRFAAQRKDPGVEREIAAAARERDESRERYDELEDRYTKATSRIDELEAALRLGTPGTRSASAESDNDRTPGDGTAGGSVDGPHGAAARDGSGIDWSGFRDMFARSLDQLIAMKERGDAGEGEEMSAEEQALIMEFMTETMRLRAQALELSDNPFFDESIFTELANAILSEAFGLSEDQVAQLDKVSRDIHGRRTSGLALDEVSPVDGYRLRREIVGEFVESMGGLLADDQHARFDDASSMIRAMMDGSPTVTEIGLGMSQAELSVLSFFEEAYLLSNVSNAESLRPVATSAVADARAILDRYGRLQDEPYPLTPAESAELELEFLQLQLRLEQTLVPMMDPALLAAFREKGPHLLRFGPDAGVTKSHSMGMLF